jgi:hypothetical protein
MNQIIYNALIKVARTRKTISYSELGKLFNLNMENPIHRDELAAYLGEISTFEVRHGRPMLTAVVVHLPTGNKLYEKEDPIGKGFFNLARELDKLKDGVDENEFFYSELQAVFDEWGK